MIPLQLLEVETTVIKPLQLGMVIMGQLTQVFSKIGLEKQLIPVKENTKMCRARTMIRVAFQDSEAMLVLRATKW